VTELNDITTLPTLFELEAEIMDEVWRVGETSVRAVHDALNAQGDKTRAYTTIMTVMQRLDSKGFLQRRREGRCDLYEARIGREAYHDMRASVQVDELVEQYGEMALVNFARTMASLDPARRRQLSRLARRG
jgi:predicted transcriptional regulator